MILILFALPDESRPFVRSLKNRKVTQKKPLIIHGTIGSQEIVLFHVGMGKPACETSLQSPNLTALQPEWLISAGVAGALNPKIDVADVFLISNFSNSSCPSPFPKATMITTDTVLETEFQKQQLHHSSQADLVDMETKYIAQYATDRSIPFLSLRSVSDHARGDFAVPSHLCFDQKRQRPNILPLLGYLATHPAKIPPFARFVRDVGKASQSLAKALVQLIETLPTSKTPTSR